jgi:hypothetical protein
MMVDAAIVKLPPVVDVGGEATIMIGASAGLTSDRSGFAAGSEEDCTRRVDRRLYVACGAVYVAIQIELERNRC